MYPDRNEIACDCMSVTVGDLEDAVAAGARTVEAVIEITKAGQGCGACGIWLGPQLFFRQPLCPSLAGADG